MEKAALADLSFGRDDLRKIAVAIFEQRVPTYLHRTGPEVEERMVEYAGFTVRHEFHWSVHSSRNVQWSDEFGSGMKAFPREEELESSWSTGYSRDSKEPPSDHWHSMKQVFTDLCKHDFKLKLFEYGYRDCFESEGKPCLWMSNKELSSETWSC